jgi:D,D-heptose 1,7-bisphosphate phosphatase
MIAVILAGGKGTRLGDVTKDVPKPMVLIGEKPLLQHQVELLVRYGIESIIILVNHLKDPIIGYFGDGTRFGATIRYFEEPVPLGTVGGIKAIEEQLTEDFLVLYGDVMVDMDLSRFIRFHHQHQSQCSLVLHPNDHPFDSDLVETDPSGRVIAFHPKPHDTHVWYHNLVNAGVYILTPAVLKYLEKDKKADFGREVFPRIFRNIRMVGYHTSEYLKDMGTPERLEKVRQDFKAGKIGRMNLGNRQKAVFLDRDGVLNVERSFISTPEGLDLYDFTPAAVRNINQAGYLAVVVTNQSAIARNLCTEEEVQTIHAKLETLLGNEHAWLDAIYYCPHHPDKGFPEENKAYKIDCDCRKPKTGMFLKAIDKFNISIQDSYMIGDSERDIQAGINAGCITMGVRTGYGIKKTRVLPDYMFENLEEAVNFIIKDPYRNFGEIIQKAYQGHKGKSPWIVLIGGNSRTGKSTLASYLSLMFSKEGHRVLRVALDHWLLPEKERNRSMNVYERFRLHEAETDLERLFGGEALTRGSYINHPERTSLPLKYDPVEKDIIIVEGVVALSSPRIRERSNLKLFTTVSPEVFAARMNAYYRWRGKTAKETESLVNKRKTDEYQLIEKESNLADLVINPLVP